MRPHPKHDTSVIANMYFTSWQFVRPGGFRWADVRDQDLPTWGERGDKGARFVPDAPHGVRLVAQKPERVKLDNPLGEDPAGMPGALTILFHDGRYKCWYTVHPKSDEGEPVPLRGHNHYLCYAESKDAFAWRKPKLGLFPQKSSGENNIVFPPNMGSPHRGLHGQGVFLDAHGPADERFKMIYLGHFSAEEAAAYRAKYPNEIDPMAVWEDGSAWGLAGAVSPDGIRWKALPEPMRIQHADTLNVACYDPQRKQYVCYARTWVKDPRSLEGFGAIGRRAVARAVSDDFRHWRNFEVLLNTGADLPPSHVWYGSGKTCLPGQPDQQVMFSYRWKLEDDTIDVELLSSPDGWTWSLVPDGPVLPPGKPGTWEGGYVVPCGEFIELPDGRWALPYNGYPILHKYPRVEPQRRKRYPGVAAGRGYAIWPKGRLVALQADDEGEFGTIGVVPAGERVFLNASVASDGFIKVGAQVPHKDIPNRALSDCDAIRGRDALEIPVTWKGEDKVDHHGDPVILRFQLKKARIFGAHFR